MKRILVATHGDYASGAVSAATLIAGEKKHIQCINAYTQSKNLKASLASYFENVKKEDEVIVLTDLFGGSVNQALMPYVQQGNVYLITGFNLALLLEICMLDEASSVNEMQLQRVIEASKSQVMYVNDVLQANQEDDFN